MSTMRKTVWRRSTAVATAMIGAVSLLVFSRCEDPGSYGEVEPVIYDRVLVHESTTSPPMDDPRNDIWRDAVSTVVFASDSAFADSIPVIDSLPVYIKAIKTAEYLYLRVRWGENPLVGRRTYSVWPNPIVHRFTVDTVAHDTTDFWFRRNSYDDADTIRNDQDRFVIVWDVGDNGGEGADCRSMCHAVGDTSILGHRMYTTGGGHVDVWHWQVATSDPVLLARDEYWGTDGRAVDLFTQRVADTNFNALGARPVSMHTDSTRWFRPFLHSDDAVAFDTLRIWKDLDSLPGYVVHDNASGSIADVDCFSSFSRTDGTWTILMRRQLTTGNADDIDLAVIAPGDSVMVSVAFMDNARDVHHGSRPFYMIFPQ